MQFFNRFLLSINCPLNQCDKHRDTPWARGGVCLRCSLSRRGKQKINKPCATWLHVFWRKIKQGEDIKRGGCVDRVLSSDQESEGVRARVWATLKERCSQHSNRTNTKAQGGRVHRAWPRNSKEPVAGLKWGRVWAKREARSYRAHKEL